MKLLLTNDDGILSEGLHALYNIFCRRHDVTVVAPDRERSAVGHGITLHTPLRCSKVGLGNGAKGYAVTGFPADCIKLGVNEILGIKPDMVISGINPGANVGLNVNYSGTVAAAKEAALYGIPAISVSMAAGSHLIYTEIAGFMEKLSAKVLDEGLAAGTFLNVNFPNLPFDQIRGVRLCRQGIGRGPEIFDKRLDPRNQVYYWQRCNSLPAIHHPDIDSSAVDQGFIAITPIKCDMTDYQGLEGLKRWGLENEFS